MPSAVIYCRVSTEEQAQGLSLDAQERVCRQYAEARDWLVKEVYVEAQSAFDDDANRPQFERMLLQAQQRQTDFIVVWKQDRIYRSAWRTLKLLADLSKAGVGLHSTQEDLTNFLLAGIGAVIAENESRQTSQRVKLAFTHAVSQGLWPHGEHRSALGVRRKDRRIIWDDREGALVQELFERYAGGYSLSDLCRWLIAQGPTRARLRGTSGMRKLLMNPVYIGKVRWKGDLYDGQHELLIEPDLFERVQQLLKQRYQHQVSSRGDYTVSGLARCGRCGSRLYIDRTRNRYGTAYQYFHCNAGCGIRVRADHLEHWLRKEIARWTLDSQTFEEFVLLLNEKHARESEEYERRRDTLLHNRQEAEARLRRLVDYLLDGALSREDYLRRQPEMAVALRQSERELSELAPPESEIVTTVASFERLPLLLSDDDPGPLREMLAGLHAMVLCSGKRWQQWELRMGLGL